LTKAGAAAAPAAFPKSAKLATEGLPLVLAGGMPSGGGLPGALAKSIEMRGPAPKMAHTTGAHASPAAPSSASGELWQQSRMSNVDPVLPPDLMAGAENGALPLQIALGTAQPGMAISDSSAASPPDSSGAAAEPMHISVGASPETLTAASSAGEDTVEIADDANDDLADELDGEEPEDGAALLEVLQSILPSPEDEMLEAQGESQEA